MLHTLTIAMAVFGAMVLFLTVIGFALAIIAPEESDE